MTAGSIFLVDDDPKNLSLLAGILGERGYQVRAANSGRRALAMIEERAPDLIMLDVTMPELDGYEVCRRLKANPATHDIPIIFISALDDVLDKVRAFEVGGVDYVQKPFQAQEVAARVGTHLGLARLRRELEARNAELREALGRADFVFSALSRTLPGTVLDGRYRLEEEIGSGGYGVVYRATQFGLERSVAVKVFRPAPGNSTPESLERFRREGTSACRVNHPDAVSVVDFAVSSTGIAYLVMELLEGRTLADALAETPVLSPRRVSTIGSRIAAVLAVAHSAGIVHRDVKPENIFLLGAGDRESIKVVDFGVAKLLDSPDEARGVPDTTGNELVGTPVYIAPERLLGRHYDGSADVYSLGVTMYRMLAGKLPFGGNEATVPAIIVEALRGEPESPSRFNPEVPPSLERLTLLAMSRDPADRPTAAALVAALSTAQ
jgi:eukaryotic-like serine/threonine-protein kinase